MISTKGLVNSITGTLTEKAKHLIKVKHSLGVDYAQGLKAVDALKEVFPGYDLAQIALRYILMFDAVSTVIPGASRPEQVYSNVKAANLLPLTEQQMSDVEAIYDHFIKASVHHLW